MLNPWMKGTFNCQSTAQWKVGREDRYCNGKWHSAGSFAKRPFNLHWILCPTWNTEVSCSLQMKRLLLLSESHQTKWWCTQIHRSIALFWCQRNLFEERLQPTLHSRHSELFSCWVSTSKWILLLSCRRWCFVYAPTTQQNSRKDDAMVTWISHVSPYEVLQLWSWGATRRTATQPLASSSTSSIVELRSYY